MYDYNLPWNVPGDGKYMSVCLHLSKLLLGVLHTRVDCVSLCICLLVSHRCVSLLVRVWALDVWGQLVPSKIFNPQFPVLKAGHSLSYTHICHVMFLRQRHAACQKWGGLALMKGGGGYIHPHLA